MKNRRIITLITFTVVGFVTICLAGALIFKDKRDENALVCLLTFGKYESIYNCSDGIACEDKGGDFYCDGGIFGISLWKNPKCPDHWWENRMLGSERKQYFKYGEVTMPRSSINRETVDWIISNCNIKMEVAW